VSFGAAELQARLARREPTFVLDVRAAREFAAWRIDVPEESTRNVPYMRMLGDVEGDDLAGAIARYAETHLVQTMPRGPLVVAVCAKGGTSEIVAAGLRTLGYEAVSLAGGMRAWGDWYDVRTVVDEGERTLIQVARPARGCLSWVLVSRGEALVVDPLRRIEPYRDLAEMHGARIVSVVDTHAHADHVSGGRALATAAGARYWLHPYDAIHPIDVRPGALAYEPLRDRLRLAIGACEIETLHVPGHTLGAVALAIDGMRLLAGDTLFVRSIARPDLGGKAEAWTPLHQASLRRLLDLPGETVVLPGHFSSQAEASESGAYAASIAELRERNDGARRALGDEAAFAAYILASLPTFPESYLEIKRVNLGLAFPDAERAAELELGKNVCALAPAAV
jgi:glyoxylase-like metal-dependent hydrolase (beta-lactamase superfamily II)/rhodanese-related sulfurtransferase